MSWPQAMFFMFLGGFAVSLISTFIKPREGMKRPHHSTDRKHDVMP